MDPGVIQFIFKPSYLLLEVKTSPTRCHGHTTKYTFTTDESFGIARESTRWIIQAKIIALSDVVFLTYSGLSSNILNS